MKKSFFSKNCTHLLLLESFFTGNLYEKKSTVILHTDKGYVVTVFEKACVNQVASK